MVIRPYRRGRPGQRHQRAWRVRHPVSIRSSSPNPESHTCPGSTSRIPGRSHRPWERGDTARDTAFPGRARPTPDRRQHSLPHHSHRWRRHRCKDRCGADLPLPCSRSRSCRRSCSGRPSAEVNERRHPNRPYCTRRSSTSSSRNRYSQRPARRCSKSYKPSRIRRARATQCNPRRDTLACMPSWPSRTVGSPGPSRRASRCHRSKAAPPRTWCRKSHQGGRIRRPLDRCRGCATVKLPSVDIDHAIGGISPRRRRGFSAITPNQGQPNDRPRPHRRSHRARVTRKELRQSMVALRACDPDHDVDELDRGFPCPPQLPRNLVWRSPGGLVLQASEGDCQRRTTIPPPSQARALPTPIVGWFRPCGWPGTRRSGC